MAPRHGPGGTVGVEECLRHGGMARAQLGQLAWQRPGQLVVLGGVAGHIPQAALRAVDPPQRHRGGARAAVPLQEELLHLRQKG